MRSSIPVIAKDGEGATKLIEVKVVHARSSEDAYRVALSVAKSPLVKTMVFGEDANWGRILTAVGYSGAKLDPAKCGIRIGGLEMCRNGAAVAFDEAAAKTILAGDEILIEIDLNDGTAWDRIWTCDFTYDYVKINGSYRT
jgi:glutamate N-acetyltransferase/amino-acid N-acetyltransferase